MGILSCVTLLNQVLLCFANVHPVLCKSLQHGGEPVKTKSDVFWTKSKSAPPPGPPRQSYWRFFPKIRLGVVQKHPILYSQAPLNYINTIVQTKSTLVCTILFRCGFISSLQSSGGHFRVTIGVNPGDTNNHCTVDPGDTHRC